jgi:hypothetical protein
MINVLSFFSLIGVFATAVNLMCASSPATVVQLLQLTANM